MIFSKLRRTKRTGMTDPAGKSSSATPSGESKHAQLSYHKRRNLWSSQKGNVAIAFAVTLPIIAGGAGLGVESSYWYFMDLQAQAAADAAAYSGAIEKRKGAAQYQIVDSATASAINNSFDPNQGTIQVNSPPLTGPNTANSAVEVLITMPLERFFSKLFLDSDVTVNARAVAQFDTDANACVLALDPIASSSVLFSGSSIMNLVGCNIMTNSIAADAIISQGSSELNVDCLVSSGGVDLTGTVTLTECINPIVNAPQVADPYADLPVPTPTGPCLNSNGSTLSPGFYCHGITMNHSKTLDPGIYFVSGGDFRANGGASVTGHDVTIYLDGDARVHLNGNANIDLRAPISGVYSGVLFFGDRNNTDSQANIFNGTVDSNLTGGLYFASQPVDYNGDFAGTNGCTRIVANTIGWNGNAEFRQDCSALGLREIPSIQIVRIAE